MKLEREYITLEMYYTRYANSSGRVKSIKT